MKLALLLGLALAGCGTTKPPPPASCVTACNHEVDLNCGATLDECEQRCTQVASQLPEYPACIAAKATCPEIRICQ